jgi:hypothetical protein
MKKEASSLKVEGGGSSISKSEICERGGGLAYKNVNGVSGSV